MRRFARVALLCLGCAVCSLLYGLSQLALSLEQPGGGGRDRQAREPATPGARRQAGSAGRGEAGSGRYGAGDGAGDGAGGGSCRIPAGRAGRRGSAPLAVPERGAGPGGRRRGLGGAVGAAGGGGSVRSLPASRGPGKP